MVLTTFDLRYFPMFVVEVPISVTTVEHHALDSILSEALRIKSTTNKSARSILESIFAIVDDVGAR